MPIDLRHDWIVRLKEPRPDAAKLLKEAGVAAVLIETESGEYRKAAETLGLTVLTNADFTVTHFADPAPSGEKPALLAEGIWPGIRQPPRVRDRSNEAASASQEPWVDSNGYLAAYLRALAPAKPALIGYPAPAQPAGEVRVVPFDSHALALAEIRTAGGNLVLDLEDRFRQSLFDGKPEALAAWRKTAATAQWLKQHASLFEQPAFPEITALVEPGRATAELANLLFRRVASPRLLPVTEPPEAGDEGTLVLIAASIEPPSDAVRKRILAFAEAGGTVVTDGGAKSWWMSNELVPDKEQIDRIFYQIGKGRVVGYKRRILDPSEFALDMIDLITHRKRAVRIWNAGSVIARAVAGPAAGAEKCAAVLTALNYGARRDVETLAHVQGHYKAAQLISPELEAPQNLEIKWRGSTSEVSLPPFDRLLVVRFQA